MLKVGVKAPDFVLDSTKGIVHLLTLMERFYWSFILRMTLHFAQSSSVRLETTLLSSLA